MIPAPVLPDWEIASIAPITETEGLRIDLATVASSYEGDLHRSVLLVHTRGPDPRRLQPAPTRTIRVMAWDIDRLIDALATAKQRFLSESGPKCMRPPPARA